ncbi:hypothetical protein V1512DRAFT_291752 [Lipomyces arxii]|uniref:uncharacterized protein n=1 Tax=Lipomyces arxii TaxID=56418 RepID=UPI0034CF2C1D
MSSTTEVPVSVTTKSLVATFKQNKDLSSSVDEVLKVQGVAWTIRMALRYAPVTLQGNLYLDEDGVEHYDILMLLPAGAKSDEPRILDFRMREKVSPVFGPVFSQSKRVTIAQAAEIFPFLAQGWDDTTQETGLIYAHAEGNPLKKNGHEWDSHQTFGFAIIQVDEKKTERKYVARLVFNAPGMPQPVEKRLVYDFVREGL